MFSLIKWLGIITVVVAIWYFVSLFMALNEDEINHVKKGAIEAIDTGDSSAFTQPISEKVKSDLLQKKQSFLEQMRGKVRDSIDRLFE